MYVHVRMCVCVCMRVIKCVQLVHDFHQFAKQLQFRKCKFLCIFLVYIDNLEVTGVSRCGRVRKKSSKLVDFQSPDDIETEKAHRRSTKSTTAKAQRSLTHPNQTPDRLPKSTIKSYFQPVPRFQKPVLHQSTESLSESTAIDIETIPDLITTDRDLDLLSSLTKFDDDDETMPNNNDDDNSDDYELVVDQTVRNSAYMSEKKPKKSAYGENRSTTINRTQRKDKGKPRFTAYMLWSKEVRQEMFRSSPDLSFSQVSRRLSQMWANVPNNEKHIWRRRAKRITMKTKKALKTGEKMPYKYLNKAGQKKPGRKPKIPTTAPEVAAKSKTKRSKGGRRSVASNENKRSTVSHKKVHSDKRKKINGGSTNHSSAANSQSKISLPGTGVIDVAAHLKLLGDNLTIIGQRLKEHEVCC